ncbi:hypothetical protein LIA77_11302 [Sarocladium implicatum]|nr:hypothetical protein LIA77_11302 [Sarocladium implicatum]
MLLFASPDLRAAAHSLFWLSVASALLQACSSMATLVEARVGGFPEAITSAEPCSRTLRYDVFHLILLLIRRLRDPAASCRVSIGLFNSVECGCGIYSWTECKSCGHWLHLGAWLARTRTAYEHLIKNSGSENMETAGSGRHRTKRRGNRSATPTKCTWPDTVAQPNPAAQGGECNQDQSCNGPV